MSENASESLNASFTDLMTSLAVIFILLLVAATNATVHRFQQEQRKSTNEREELINKLRQIFADIHGIDVKGEPSDPLGVIVVLPEGLLNLSEIITRFRKKVANFCKALFRGLRRSSVQRRRWCAR